MICIAVPIRESTPLGRVPRIAAISSDVMRPRGCARRRRGRSFPAGPKTPQQQPGQVLPARVRDGGVNGDPVQRDARRARPLAVLLLSEGPFERLARQILRGCGIEDYRPDDPVDPGLVDLVEVFELAGQAASLRFVVHIPQVASQRAALQSVEWETARERLPAANTDQSTSEARHR
jgi:hypothetical protein